MTVPQTSTLDHPKHVARLRLKPKAPSTGYVDGAWWPASRDLEGFRSQHFDSLTVVGTAGRRRLTLLVVPPETEPELAHHLLMTAAHRDSVDDFETLLASRFI